MNTHAPDSEILTDVWGATYPEYLRQFLQELHVPSGQLPKKQEAMLSRVGIKAWEDSGDSPVFFASTRIENTRKMCQQLLHVLEETPGARAFAFARYREHLYTPLMRTWYDLLPQEKIQRLRKQRKECYLTNGSSLTFRSPKRIVNRVSPKVPRPRHVP